MTDEELASAWLAASLGRAITHEEHVRIAFVLLRDHGREHGSELIRRGTSENSAALGSAEKYDEELTDRWSAAIADAAGASPDADALLREHPELLDSRRLGLPRWATDG